MFSPSTAETGHGGAVCNPSNGEVRLKLSGIFSPTSGLVTYTYNPTTQKDHHEFGVSLGYRETLSQHITSPNNKTIAKIAAT